jgi:hypothetical protein
VISVAATTYVAASIAHFISPEVGDPSWALCRRGSFAAIWQTTSVAALRIETVVYVTVKIVTAVKPWTCTNENTSCKPFRAVVAVGSAGIWRVVVVTIRAIRSDADADDDLSFCFANGRSGKAGSSKNGHGNALKSIHDILLTHSDQLQWST